MAKRKVAKEEKVVEPDVEYEIGKWAGYAQYTCRKCAYDTLDLEQMLAHMTTVHPPVPACPGGQARAALVQAISGQKPTGTPVAEIPTPGGQKAGKLSAADDAAQLVAEDAATYEVELKEVENGTTNPD